MTSEAESQLKNTGPQPNTKKASKRIGLLTGACYSNMHSYCPAKHTPQVCQCKCHDK